MNFLRGAATPAATTSRQRKTLSDRLGSLFASTPSHLHDFYIDLDDPVKHYGPGDTISGKVVLNVARPLGVTHIVLCLSGHVQVFKANSKPKPPNRNLAGRPANGRGKRWVSEYHGDGFASLFEDEIVLCGEGRLDPKLYHFRFKVEFPNDLTLPSSIDFERGTIQYMVSSTITRPASMAPTTTCERKVYFRDHIDVSALPPPKPRIVTLEPIDRASKTKFRRLTPHSMEKQRNSSTSNTSKTERSDRTVLSQTSLDANRPTIHDSPTVISLQSETSSHVRDVRPQSEPSSGHSASSPKDDTDTRASKIITATVQLMRSGCLPGEIIPLKVSVQHTKSIRSLNGIIATLYRQARVDMHPSLPIGSVGGREAVQFEDYYPRSKTGLGGLSLSAAGSSQMWRKDLSQTFAPLYIDPQTMSADVKLGVRVPDDAFPSIRNAPGEMIDFEYFVEVIIDIHGRLSNHDRTLQSLDITATVQPTYASGSTMSKFDDGSEHTVTAWGSNCIDTTTIRREKNAIACLCDVVIGTKDLTKKRGKQPVVLSQEQAVHVPPRPFSDERGSINGHGNEDIVMDNGTMHGTENPNHANGYGDGYDGHEYAHGYAHGYGYDYNNGQGESYDDGYDYGYGYDYDYNNRYGYGYDYDYGYGHNHDHDYNAVAQAHSYPYGDPRLQSANTQSNLPFPPPNLAGEENMDEKKMLQQAEARLLPSRPPEAEHASSSRLDQAAPTAPYLPEEQDYDSPQAYRAAVEGAVYGTEMDDAAVDSFGTSAAAPQYTRGNEPGPASLENGHMSPVASDDKQELQRQRLMAQASAPDDEARPGQSATPSAPRLEESSERVEALDMHERSEDIAVRNADGDAAVDVSQTLPRYTR